MKNTETAVVKTDNSIPANLIELALKQKAPVEQLEKLLAMQERFEKANAEKEFNLAMASFQKKCPVIVKRKIVKNKAGQERYRFAPIGDIIRQVKDLLAKHDLFYDFTKEDSEGFLTAICTVTHKNGHSKQSSFKVPIGKEDYMTDVQKYGARRTFANRYAFCDVLGITTADADIDGRDPVSEPKSKLSKSESLERLNKSMVIIGEFTDHKEFIAKYKKIGQDERKAGMHQKHLANLKRCINAKGVALKKAKMNKTIKLP